MKTKLYVVAAIAGVLLVVLGVRALDEHMAGRMRAEEARKQAIALARLTNEWNAKKTEITADIARALKENRPKQAQDLLERYREASGGELNRYEQQLKVALAVEGLNAIPQSQLIAREGALGELARLDPDNPRWRRELLALTAQRRKNEQHEKQQRRSEGVSIGMTQDRVLQSSWGKPESVNRTIYPSGTREQWVYGNGHYLYFENGILTSIQTRN